MTILKKQRVVYFVDFVILLSAVAVLLDVTIKNKLFDRDPSSAIPSIIAGISTWSYILFPNQTVFLLHPTIPKMSTIAWFNVGLAVGVSVALTALAKRIGVGKAILGYVMLSVLATAGLFIL